MEKTAEKSNGNANGSRAAAEQDIAAKNGENPVVKQIPQVQFKFLNDRYPGSGYVQPKLKIGSPNDKYEQEADQVADQVMTMPESNLQPKIEKEEEHVQPKRLADTITPLVQRQVEPSFAEASGDKEEEEPIQAKCEECEEEEPIQSKLNIQRKEEEEEEEVQPSLIQKQPIEEEEEEPIQPKLDEESSSARAPEDEEESIQTKPNIQKQEEEEDELAQTKPLQSETTSQIQRKVIDAKRDASSVFQPLSPDNRISTKNIVAEKYLIREHNPEGRLLRLLVIDFSTRPPKVVSDELMSWVSEKVRTKFERMRIKRLLNDVVRRIKANEEYQSVLDEASQKAVEMLDRKTSALDPLTAKKEVVKELVKTAEDVMSLGAGEKAVETALNKVLKWSKNQLEKATKNLKETPTKTAGKKVANKVALVMTLGGDAKEAAELLIKLFPYKGGSKEDQSSQTEPVINKKELPIQKQTDNIEEEEEPIQAKSNGQHQKESSKLQSRLNSSKGGGTPLQATTNQFMSQAFGTDFGKTRIHTDSAAVQMNKELGAQAFTHGSDIYFNQGKFDPGSSSGKRLLAHELTHTVQQGPVMRFKYKMNDEIKEVRRGDSEIRKAPQIQRQVTSEKSKYKFNQLIKNKDIDGIKDLDVENLKMATTHQKTQMVFCLLGQDWVGPFDEFAIIRIFRATSNPFNLLTEIAKKKNGLDDLVSKVDNRWFKLNYVTPFASIFQERFKKVAVERAKLYLNRNKEYLELLKEEYGFSESQGSLDDLAVRDRIEELKSMAQSYLAIDEGIVKLSRKIADILGPYAIGQAISESIIPTKIPTLGTVWTELPVDLEKVPARVRIQVLKLDRKRKTLYNAKRQLETDYPTLIPIIEDRELTKFTKMESAYEASKLILAKLDEVIAKIEETKEKLSGGEDADLDILDVPKALNLVKKENPEFKKPFPRWAVDDMIKSHQRIKLARNIAIGVGVGAAFIFSEIATAGQATWFWLAVGIGLGITGAAMNMEEALDLIAASKTDIRKDRKLVAEEAARSALLWAMVDIILTGLDIVQVGKGLRLLKARSARVLKETGEQTLKETGEDVTSKALKEAGLKGSDFQKAAKKIGKEVAKKELKKISHFREVDLLQIPIYKRLEYYKAWKSYKGPLKTRSDYMKFRWAVDNNLLPAKTAVFQVEQMAGRVAEQFWSRISGDIHWDHAKALGWKPAKPDSFLTKFGPREPDFIPPSVSRRELAPDGRVLPARRPEDALFIADTKILEKVLPSGERAVRSIGLTDQIKGLIEIAAKTRDKTLVFVGQQGAKITKPLKDYASKKGVAIHVKEMVTPSGKVIKG